MTKLITAEELDALVDAGEDATELHRHVHRLPSQLGRGGHSPFQRGLPELSGGESGC